MHFHGGSAVMSPQDGSREPGEPLAADDEEAARPVTTSSWQRKVRNQIPLETLDRIGTRAACPVHLIRRKAPTYAHVKHKVDTPRQQRGRKIAWEETAEGRSGTHSRQWWRQQQEEGGRSAARGRVARPKAQAQEGGGGGQPHWY